MKIYLGKVYNVFMNKTITVLVCRIFKHYKYNKFIKKIKKYHVHDEYNLALKDEYIEFIYYKPISKTKNWVLLRIL